MCWWARSRRCDPKSIGLAIGLVILFVASPQAIEAHQAEAGKEAVATPATKQVKKEEAVSPSNTLEGLWPSPRLMDLMLARWADELSREYELDDTQRAKVREAVTKRWSGFLNEHRSMIQPIANEFVEMRLELEPPPDQRVQDWAKRATPVFGKFREQFEQGTAEFREILTPLQRSKFEFKAMQFSLGMQVVEEKLKQWQRGEIDSKEFWEPTARHRRGHQDDHRRQHEAANTKQRAAETVPKETDQIALELKAWREYVEAFVRIYNLDEGQRTSVVSILSELKQRAISHRDGHREAITRLEQRIHNFTGSKEEQAELKKQLTELYGPIDEMFNELKRRIEQVPTTAQRETAVKNDE